MIDIELTGVDEVLNRMNDLGINAGVLNRHVKIIIRKAISEARKHVKSDARAAVPADPRKAYMAVRHTIYKRVLGGNINILSKSKANGKMYVGSIGRGTLRIGQRGGNRMRRSERTEKLYSYWGSDRGFVLRFLNAGTSSRTTNATRANRGSISARNWFASSASKNMEQAAETICQMVERAVKEVWMGKTS